MARKSESPTPSGSPEGRSPLRRTLSLWQLSVYGVGTIVGAGVYSVIGAAAGKAGDALWLSFIGSGLAALLAALSYAELASMESRAGAEYQYLRAAFPRWPFIGFVAGYLIALNASATAATVALGFGGYLRVFFDLPIPLAALLLLLTCTAVNIAGIRQSTWVSLALITIEVGGLVLLAGAGWLQGEPGRVIPATELSGQWAGTFAASALLFFMFIGFEDVANLSEEARCPRRDVPRALLLAVAITTLLYVAVGIAVLALISPQQLAASDSPLTTAGAQVTPWLGQALGVSALFATASTALITLISISRLLFGMAREGDLPAPLARVLPARNTPWIAALALFTAAVLLLPLGEVRITASVSALGLLCVFMTIHGAVIYLRLRQPQRERGFRVPVTLGRVPVLPVLGLLICAAFTTQFEGKVYGIVALALLLGVGLYAYAQPRRTRPRRGSSKRARAKPAVRH